MPFSGPRAKDTSSNNAESAVIIPLEQAVLFAVKRAETSLENGQLRQAYKSIAHAENLYELPRYHPLVEPRINALVRNYLNYLD
ncbi:hypothetical protein J4479_00990 [Candidatus Woesearchaeota archaeon]|nr:hypothetical protein [Candidatus Woesearchaeota archaeon]